jgi:hypothetical protein
METQPKKPYGCLKTILYLFVGLLALSFIAELFSEDEVKLSDFPANKISPGFLARIDSTKKAKADQDSISKELAIKEDKKHLRGLRVSKDDFDNVAFYYGGSIPYVNTNRLYLYMSYQEGHLPGLRLRVQYAGDSWIFWNEAEVKVDGKKMSLLGMGKVDRDNDAGLVWETTDSPIDGRHDGANNLAVMRKIAMSKTTVIRLSGDKRKDRTITSKEKKSMRDILAAYDALMLN